jgi:hypothetical protein
MKKLSLICCFIPFVLFAQEADFQSWSKAEVQYKLHKKLSSSLSQGYRLRENASLPDKGFTTLSLVYKLDKNLKVGLGYRLNENFDLDQKVSFQNRFFTDVYLRKKSKRWLFKNRLRYQNQNQKHTIRNKLGASYNLRKTSLEPFAAAEVFYSLNLISKLRYTLGASYPISKKLSLDLFYRIQDEINIDKPTDLYILGTALKFKI